MYHLDIPDVFWDWLILTDAYELAVDRTTSQAVTAAIRLSD